MKKAFKSIVHRTFKYAQGPVRKKRLNRMSANGLPIVTQPAIRFLIDGKTDIDVKQVVNRIEKIRSNIASQGNKKVEILYSPKPCTTSINREDINHESLRPSHGEQRYFTMEQIARTGKNKMWGIVLYLLARESKAKIMLELGSCAGISGAYLASSEHCQILHTVEGSSPLASLSSHTISQISSKFAVHNKLFDDALDELLPNIEQVDLAFIDGHHEKIATIHYWQRIAPKMIDGGIVIFDDISWSQDMRDCWNYLSTQSDFSHAMDLGSIGVCICGTPSHTQTHTQTKPFYWDLQPVVGKKRIGTPHGWKDS